MKNILAKAKKLGCEVPHKKWSDIDRELKPVLRAMEKVGIKIDTKILDRLNLKLKTQSSKLEKEIQKLAGEEFNVASPSQLSEILFKKMKLPTVDIKRNKSGISTGASELLKIRSEHKIIDKILEYRELSKLISTYLEPLPKLVDKNSRLHTTFGEDTRTSRLTSSNPNLQNIPIKGEFGPEIRSAFIAEPGNKLISADYSQIELRVVACLAKDEVMMKAFRDGIDIHTKTASEIFNRPVAKITHDQRRVAKTVNFGVLYGISPYGLSQTLGIKQEEAARYIMQYFKIHSGIKRYCEQQIALAKKHGYVETLFGFRRPLPEIRSSNRNLYESAQRMAINTPVQGTAAEILKLAMIELHRKLKSYQSSVISYPKNGKQTTDHGKLILTVHDELIIEAPEKEAEKIAQLMREVMESEVKLSVPVEVEVGVGDNWDSAKRNIIT
ncbi:MAG: DNA polymerase [Candidatus Berkelbacteria bacterium]|nr:DNA polymerase [Candidatus Berkelbacteria bacterium]